MTSISFVSSIIFYDDEMLCGVKSVRFTLLFHFYPDECRLHWKHSASAVEKWGN